MNKQKGFLILILFSLSLFICTSVQAENSTETEVVVDREIFIEMVGGYAGRVVDKDKDWGSREFPIEINGKFVLEDLTDASLDFSHNATFAVKRNVTLKKGHWVKLEVSVFDHKTGRNYAKGQRCALVEGVRIGNVVSWFLPGVGGTGGAEAGHIAQVYPKDEKSAESHPPGYDICPIESLFKLTNEEFRALTWTGEKGKGPVINADNSLGTLVPVEGSYSMMFGGRTTTRLGQKVNPIMQALPRVVNDWINPGSTYFVLYAAGFNKFTQEHTTTYYRVSTRDL